MLIKANGLLQSEFNCGNWARPLPLPLGCRQPSASARCLLRVDHPASCHQLGQPHVPQNLCKPAYKKCRAEVDGVSASVMRNRLLGLVYGAMATAIGQGRFRLAGEAPQSLAALARSGGGGLLMGYGGVMSFSPHG